uniref:Cadherin domain-containing protein n=1 Tax=Sus scrofa TaxID=9823 RepID=A0A8D1PGG5_PIG
MFATQGRGLDPGRLLLSFLLLAAWEAGSGQVRYSVPEEAKHGTFVGRIAQDLGLEQAELVPRLFRMASKGGGDLLEVNLQNGILFVNSRIDREELCGRSLECSIHLEVIVERPLQVFHVEVEVKDINDNPPVFSLREQKLLISESKQPDSHFPLEGASDADIGENAQLTYRLSQNEYFSLELPTNSKQIKRLSLILKKSLDREKTPELNMLLTAADGGKPELTGTVQLSVRVLDTNDNDPEFEQSEYKVRLMENAAKDTLVIRLNATDRDEGVNGEVTYSLTSVKPNGRRLFTLDENDGEVEVKDINDNPPVFPESEKRIIIAESRPPETRFPLDGASDADIGVNSALTYQVYPNDYFTLDPQNSREQTSSLSLVLRKSLDREEIQEHNLLLTASDGGKPELTGTVQLLITILDVNDNAPEFDQLIYKVRMLESAFNGTLVIKLNATDPDDGTNADIIYSFRRPVSPAVLYAFSINSDSGEIRTKGKLDFEERKLYEISVEAIDKGNIPMAGHCTILVEIVDVNDNAPEITITSLALPIQENAQVGTVIALISVSDRDSGANGQVTCSLTPHVPFKLVSTFKNYYSLVLDGTLDRESVASYELVVSARDGGSPSLWATARVSVEVGDVNDNAPVFAQPEYTVFVKENNAPGCHIFTVSARDADAQENARVAYSLVERRVGERALSSYVSVHAESGQVFALQPLDREELELLQFRVSARDAGAPPLGSNVTLQVFVLDENDNAPALLPQRVARWVGAGQVVAKVRAVDADSGYNAWLSYELQEEEAAAPGGARSAFRVGLYTGEISTTRALDEADAARQRLLVLVKDHGEPALTATATVLLWLEDGGAAPKASSRLVVGPAAAAEAALVDVHVYLVVAICAVSSLLVLTLLVYTALRCSAPRGEGACVPGPARLVCSSAVGSWSSSPRRRRQRVCSGEGPPKADLMAFSPSLPPCLNSAEGTGEIEAGSEQLKEVRLHLKLCFSLPHSFSSSSMFPNWFSA